MEFLIVFILILLNGVFAMSEIALISSRKTKLQARAKNGDKGAQAALDLSKSPNRFLSTVQIGITLVGIFAGAFGGATIAAQLAKNFERIPFLAHDSTAIALALVVSIITYLSLVLGELVPKKIALSNPEKIAAFMARPMMILSRVSGPLVTLLSGSTNMIFRILPVRESLEPTVSDEEIRVLLREGTQSGVFELVEKDIVERTMRLSDKKVNSIMTPRKEIVWLDVDSSLRTIKSKITRDSHANYPICNKTIDKVIGIVNTKSLLNDYLEEEKIDLLKIIHKPLFIPESMSGLKVLELFKKSGIHVAMIIDEYGNVKGLLSITDILEEIVGDIPTIDEKEEREIVKRADGTFLVDGLTPIDEFREYFKLDKLTGERSGIFHTIGGFATSSLGRIPVAGDSFEIDGYRFEVVDMDGNRVDKVIVAHAGSEKKDERDEKN